MAWILDDSGAALGEALEIESLVASSLGPCGRHKLLVTEAKQVLCTASGKHLLPTIKPQHPLLGVACRSAQAFAETHGDGSKRLLLVALAGLRAAAPHIQASQPAAAARLCHALQAAQAQHHALAAQVAAGLADALDDRLPPAPPPPTQQRAPASVDATTRSLLTALAMTHMTNQCGDSVARKLLAPLLVDLIDQRYGGSEGSSMAGVLQALAADPPIIVLPGQPLGASHILPGLVLDRAACSRLMPSRMAPARFVVLTCPLLPHPLPSAAPTPPHGVLVRSGTDYQRARLHDAHQALTLLQRLRRHCQVDLLLCTAPLDEHAVQLCLQSGVSAISSLGEDQAKAVCRAAKVAPISLVEAAMALSVEELRTQHVGRAGEVKEVPVAAAAGGAAAYGRGTALLLGPQASTLVLAAPSDALCRQYRRILTSTLRVLCMGWRQPALATAHTTSTDPAGSPRNNRQQGPGARPRCVPGGHAFEAAFLHQLSAWRDTAGPSGQSSLSHGGVTMVVGVLEAMAAAGWRASLAHGAGGGGGAAPGAGGSAVAPAVVGATGLVCASRAPSRRGRFLPAAREGVCGAAGGREGRQGGIAGVAAAVVVGDPAACGVLEPEALPVALWEAASQLVLQLLRVDMVVAGARRHGVEGALVVAPRARRVGRVVKGGAGGLDASDSGEGSSSTSSGEEEDSSW